MKRALILITFMVFTSTWAQSTDDKINVLTEEIEKLKAGKGLFKEVKENGKYGFGPAASKVYEVNQGVSIGGYGEMVYQNYSTENQSGSSSKKIDRIDALRAILYFGYKFNDNIIFNSEIEFEHGNEVGVEFAYLDFLYKDYLNARAGLLLVPMGHVNLLHEPTVFLGANRPVTEQKLLPSTWRENGLGLFGSFMDLDYTFYLVNSFDSTGQSSSANGFNASDGLRGGRQKGSKAAAENFALTGRLDYSGINGLTTGFSGFWGSTAQGSSFNAETLVTDFHLEYKFAGFQTRLLAIYIDIKDANSLNQSSSAVANSPSLAIGEQLYGGYLELGYDVLRLFKSKQEVIVYSRFEHMNTQAKLGTYGQYNGANKKNFLYFGANYKPILNLVIKADYMIETTESKSGVNQWNLSTGYIF